MRKVIFCVVFPYIKKKILLTFRFLGPSMSLGNASLAIGNIQANLIVTFTLVTIIPGTRDITEHASRVSYSHQKNPEG